MVNIHCSVHVYTDDTQQSDCAVGRHALLPYDYTFFIITVHEAHEYCL